MAILKTDTKGNDNKLIGANVPPYMHQYLTLYALAKGTTKSRLFIMLLEEWMSARRAEESDDVLIKELADRIKEQWQQRREAHSAITQDQFLELVRREAQDKGLKASYITTILSMAKS